MSCFGANWSRVKHYYSLQIFSVKHPVSELWPYWTNNTCVPTTNPNGTCTLGYLPKYVIMATKKEHIKAGIDFARTNNIRVLIRNTGHDFLGRSTGYGSLAINTHSFKDISFTTSYSGPGSYRGGAAIVGAGIQSRELYGAAAKQNPPVVVVGGECPVCSSFFYFLFGTDKVSLRLLDGQEVISREVATARWQLSMAWVSTTSLGFR